MQVPARDGNRSSHDERRPPTGVRWGTGCPEGPRRNAATSQSSTEFDRSPGTWWARPGMGNRARRIARALLAVTVGTALFLAYRSHARGAGSADCSPSERDVVMVDTATHTMSLCESGRRVDAFAVRIGHNGTSKTREGDGRTPLGTYPLAEARSSPPTGRSYPSPTPRRSSAGPASLGAPWAFMAPAGACAGRARSRTCSIRRTAASASAPTTTWSASTRGRVGGGRARSSSAEGSSRPRAARPGESRRGRDHRFRGM